MADNTEEGSRTAGKRSEEKSSTKEPKQTQNTNSTRRQKPNTYTKSDRSNIRSFLSCYASEPTLAAYLGYSDLQEFRKCEFSFYVIDYFNVYAQHCRARSAKVALELLRDVPNIQAQLPENLDDAVKTYAAAPTVFAPEPKKIEAETNLNYLMATLLFRLAATLKSPPQYTTTELSARQTAAAVTFQHVH